MTWVQATLADFAVGDRIRFIEEERDDGHEGAVEALGGRYGPDGISVRRDDGAQGCGVNATWLVSDEYNAPLYKWTEPVETLWEPCEIPDFAVGDRITFTLDYEDVVGTVLVVDPHHYAGGRLHVERDDGQRGGGVDRSFLVGAGYYSTNYRKLTNAGAVFAEQPPRAVFCLCCGLATGEVTNTAPTERYCTNCRNLPGLWEYGTPRVERTTDRTNGPTDRQRDPGRVAARMRNMNAGQYGDDTPPMRGAFVPARAPVIDEWPVYHDEDDEEDEEVHGPQCEHCNGTTFEVRGLRWCRIDDTIGYNPAMDAEAYDEGDTLYFEMPMFDETPDLDDTDARVVCAGCATTYHGQWEWE